MTRDEILNMEAGREMDALVAEEVMGIDLTGNLPELPFRGVGCEKYSTDIAAALPLLDNEPGVSIEKVGDTWAVFIVRTMTRGEGKTLPLAICLAKLRAIEK